MWAPNNIDALMADDKRWGTLISLLVKEKPTVGKRFYLVEATYDQVLAFGKWLESPGATLTMNGKDPIVSVPGEPEHEPDFDEL